MSKATHVLHLRAKNDRNGNPQRLYMVLGANGKLIDVVSEGYMGSAAYSDKYGRLPEIPINLAQGEYRAILKRWRDRQGTSPQAQRLRAALRGAVGGRK